MLADVALGEHVTTSQNGPVTVIENRPPSDGICATGGRDVMAIRSAAPVAAPFPRRHAKTGRVHPRAGVDLNRSRLSNVYSILVELLRGIPSSLEGEISVGPGESIGHGFKSCPPYKSLIGRGFNELVDSRFGTSSVALDGPRSTSVELGYGRARSVELRQRTARIGHANVADGAGQIEVWVGEPASSSPTGPVIARRIARSYRSRNRVLVVHYRKFDFAHRLHGSTPNAYCLMVSAREARVTCAAVISWQPPGAGFCSQRPRSKLPPWSKSSAVSSEGRFHVLHATEASEYQTTASSME